ncbi:MAG: hypothetical protein GEV28_35290 [Actinophytocola sp.]|uniref:hypothetical protein n=1 Tax=Actinophytocola sp. TaxID=1872138 RepID=UPI00132441A0|nr:hypothetical protein [Actinophytocola sp.]MPZ85372.1 hypothetical protein [Actinophytocola sp.]
MSISLDGNGSVRLWTRRCDESACLVIETSGTYCEIAMDRVHVEALRDQLPEVLAGLDLWAVEDDGCAKAAVAERRAVQAVARALDLAVAVEEVGVHDVSTSLRAAATEASGRAEAADAAVRAFGNATVEVDYATEKLNYAMSAAEAALRRLRNGDQLPERAVSGVQRR